MSESNLLPNENYGAVIFGLIVYVPGPSPSLSGLFVENLSPGNIVLFFEFGSN